ncbi:MAG: biotin carboxylase N-terminal domain-containing protein [Rhodoferax sp.]|nr:biotin carboxylase N-terminal domain-containing protein [Rhodoferax sp.]
MKRILIANRGEIARRVIRTAHAMGIETVAVYAEPDAQALHVREATLAFALGGTTSAESYLRVERLLEAARATGADAIHPGYGFLSEDARFAQAVQDAGLCWIGPPPAAIRALGSKSAAKALAAAQGVPCLPGYAGEDQSEERFVSEAARVGYPVMVKAVAGGGGRGMRQVADAAQLPAALASACSEALAGFGNGELLIERALLHPRHVEVQVFADTHGHCIHLGERDCSVQRRHQKIIEESPSPAVDAALRERMGACAVALAQGAGYVGAGTVEFLLEGKDFYLMEMNTRLQVEHPVTEALTGLDLVEWQIRVARGEPLPLAQHEVRLQGHAIEVRLCAEDERFTPHTGRVLHFAAPAASAFAVAPLSADARPTLRFDHAIERGQEVTPYYDAMLGKLIVHAATREAAIDALLQALGQTELLGLPTNRAFLAECLAHPQFRAGQALISFLAGEADAVRDALQKKELHAHDACGLAAVFNQNMVRQGLPCAFPRPLRLRHRDTTTALAVQELGAGRLQVQPLGPQAPPARHMQLTRLPDGAVQCVQDGLARRVRVAHAGGRRWHLQAGTVDWWLEDVSLLPAARAGAGAGATELRAPFNGRVVQVLAVAGQTLAAGDTAVVIESMKLEHSLAGAVAATVAEVLVSPGQQVAPGQVLVRFAALMPAATGEARA